MVAMSVSTHQRKGFTLIELLVVMTIIALLISIVTPRYFHSISKAEEVVLKEDLMLMRDALNKYRGDTGKYPDALDDLVTKKYLRKVPVDPITQSGSSWKIVPPDNGERGEIFDVKSGASGNAWDGTAYSDW
jgi:general secretion pathway protein G